MWDVEGLSSDPFPKDTCEGLQILERGGLSLSFYDEIAEIFLNLETICNRHIR